MPAAMSRIGRWRVRRFLKRAVVGAVVVVVVLVAAALGVLYDSGLPGVHLFKPGQGLIEGHQIHIRLFRSDNYRFIELYILIRPAALFAFPFDCVVDQDPAHHLGRKAKKMCSVLPVHVALISEPKVCLVN